MPAQYSWEKGWIQRGNRNLYEPNELLDAVNVVPDPEGGGVTTRLGDTIHSTVSGRVHSLYRTYTAEGTAVEYQGAGSVLYRNAVPLLTGLSGVPLAFASMQGLGERRVWTFFAGGAQEALRVKDDGSGVSNWGLQVPTTPVQPISNAPGGELDGTYAWKQVYVRRPIIAGGVHGRWTQATSSYDLLSFFPWYLFTSTVGDGTVLGAPSPWFDVVFALVGGTEPTTPSGSIEYAYWNGSAWVVWQTVALHRSFINILSFRTRFAQNTWVPRDGYYLIRLRAVATPASLPIATSSLYYGSFYAARSNPSPAGIASGPYGPALNNQALVNLSNPFIPPDLEPQATHVALYRTLGTDPALVASQPADAAALYFFEDDFPAAVPLHSSLIPDDQLGELLETDNDRPPAFNAITEYQERMFGTIGNRLWFSKRGFPDSFPGTNYLDIGTLSDPLRQIGSFHGQLYLWTRTRVYILLGTDETSYDTRLVQCPTGSDAPATVAAGERAIYFLGTDGHLWGLEGTIAANLSRSGHQQLFDGVTLHGVAGLTLAALPSCVGHWGKGRYYLAYPTGTATTPVTSLMIDETRASWWRDTRAWQSLLYDRRANALYGGLSDGTVVQLEQGTTDHGTPIVGVLQTWDDDAGQGTSDKDLTQLAVETMTSASGLVITPVVSYDLAATPLETIISPTWGQILVASPTPGTYRGLTLGYHLSGVAPWALYGLAPSVLPSPRRSRVWQTLPTTLGWAGPKMLDSWLLDVDLVSGTLTWSLLVDDVLTATGTLAALGRHVTQLLQTRQEGTVFAFVLQGTGRFLLYEGSALRWAPLPAPVYTDIVVPTDLGTLQDKIGLGYALDIDLLSPGTVTTTFYADGVLIHTLTYTTVGRQRTERYRLPSTMHGRLFEIRRESTALYRLWPGTDFSYQIVGTTQEQHYRQVQAPYGQFTTSAFLDLPHAQEG